MKVLPNVGATDRQRDQAINELIMGRSNAVGSVTLTPGTTSTVVERSTISSQAIVILTPQTSTACAALASSFVTVSPTGGSFTITHANASSSNRTFGYLVIGG